MATDTTHGVRLSKTSPRFLHANSTSHTWVFSAIAELIDNAYDPDVAAEQLNIDKEVIEGTTCLVFQDNGRGMDPEKLHHMLSFGYCEKYEIEGHKPVGHYGNGFKSGSMRLGKDALVFTKSEDTMSVGMLSQTYLEKIKAETVLTPILTFDRLSKQLIQQKDTAGSKEALTKYSLFPSTEHILIQFHKRMSGLACGTCIIIYNLKQNIDGSLEIDFESNPEDLRNPERIENDYATAERPISSQNLEYKRSLREYCSILYLKPRMKIILRKKKVKTRRVDKSLSRTERDFYKPMWLKKGIKITFGYSMSDTDYGLLMYHKNRLIKAYQKVGFQKQLNNLGTGVIGVVEVDFLEPIHNKQDFNKTERYNSCLYALGTKLNEYWNEKEKVHQVEKNENGEETIVLADDGKKPDWTWMQCDLCLKWRRMPEGHEDSFPDKFFCYMNPDQTHNSCQIMEEPEDEDEARATYKKTFKDQERKRKQNEKQGHIAEKEKELAVKEKRLAAVQHHLVEQAKQMQRLEESDRPAESMKPSIHDLEYAKKRLEQERITAQEKQLEIEMLRREHAAMATQLRQLQEQQQQQSAVLAAPTLVTPTEIQYSTKHTMVNNVNSQLGRRRRTTGSPEKGPASKKLKGKIEMVADDFLIMRQSDDEEEGETGTQQKDVSGSKNNDDEDDVIIVSEEDKNKGHKKFNLKVKLTGNEAEDVKPDIQELEKQVSESAGTSEPGGSHSDTDTPETSESAESKNQARKQKRPGRPNNKQAKQTDEETTQELSLVNGDQEDTEQTKQSNTKKARAGVVPASGKKGKSKSAEEHDPVACNEKLKNVENQLVSLRYNVLSLLQMIVSDLNVESLDNVDSVLTEMIKANQSQKQVDNVNNDEASTSSSPPPTSASSQPAPDEQPEVKVENDQS